MGDRRALYSEAAAGFDDLSDPKPIPRDTHYAPIVESDQPIWCMHTRLDSRQAELALLSTVVYAAE